MRACFCGSDLRRSTSGWDGRSRTEGVGGEAVAQWTCAEGVAGALRARVVGRCSRARALAPLHQTHILRLWLRDNAYDARISAFSRATSLGAGPTCWSTPQTRRCAAAQDAPAPGTSRASATSTQPVCVRVQLRAPQHAAAESPENVSAVHQVGGPRVLEECQRIRPLETALDVRCVHPSHPVHGTLCFISRRTPLCVFRF